MCLNAFVVCFFVFVISCVYVVSMVFGGLSYCVWFVLSVAVFVFCCFICCWLCLSLIIADVLCFFLCRLFCFFFFFLLFH